MMITQFWLISGLLILITVYYYKKKKYLPCKSVGNPVPGNFKIEKLFGLGEWIYAEIRYPDSVNYDGLKVLVFYKLNPELIINATEIDPHFRAEGTIKPIARFEPTEIGKLLAWHMVRRGGFND